MYDVIIVGARVAGAPLAFRLANAGLRVLALERGSFPSDVLSTHMLTGDSVERLDRWGVLDEVLRSDLPALRRTVMGVDGFAVNIHAELNPYPVIAPRRSVLDTVLVDAARNAGAEVRTGFSVQSLLCEDGRIAGIAGRDRAGNELVEHARLVVGADGRNSFVARQVGAPKYNERPIRAITYFAYYKDWESSAMETYIQDGIAAYAFPTNWGLACLGGYWPVSQLTEVRADPEAAIARAFTSNPLLADRFHRARRVERIQGSTGTAAYYRKSAGPGWALAGDAAYLKDPILASGIADAFRDADNTADAILSGYATGGTIEEHLAKHEERRARATAAAYALNDLVAGGGITKEGLLGIQAAVRSSAEARRARAA
jgi:flavin-dependent dehydrogenase